jgi:hypothetical protein
MKNRVLFLFAFVALVFINANANSLLRAGNWRGVLTRPDSIEIPFTMNLSPSADGKSFSLAVMNASEVIFVEQLKITSDSVNWRMPVFDSWFKCKRENDSVFSGTWFNNSASKPYQLKFRATYNASRFETGSWLRPPATASGKWECTFSPSKQDSSKSIGIFAGEVTNMNGTSRA